MSFEEFKEIVSSLCNGFEVEFKYDHATGKYFAYSDGNIIQGNAEAMSLKVMPNTRNHQYSMKCERTECGISAVPRWAV